MVYNDRNLKRIRIVRLLNSLYMYYLNSKNLLGKEVRKFIFKEGIKEI